MPLLKTHTSIRPVEYMFDVVCYPMLNRRERDADVRVLFVDVCVVASRLAGAQHSKRCFQLEYRVDVPRRWISSEFPLPWKILLLSSAELSFVVGAVELEKSQRYSHRVNFAADRSLSLRINWPCCFTYAYRIHHPRHMNKQVD